MNKKEFNEICQSLIKDKKGLGVWKTNNGAIRIEFKNKM